jgi:hypothetical protein
LNPARLRKIPVFSDLVLDRSLRNATVRARHESAPIAVDHLRGVVAERRRHA